MTTGFNVRKRGEYRWEVTDRRKKSALQVIDITYDPRKRAFSGTAKRRYTKVSPWQKEKPVTPAQIELAKRAIGPEEVARCIAASLADSRSSLPDPAPATAVASPFGDFLYR
ncbi:protein of unknown function [Pseudorhizobium banfieldiae]|uniref:Uncharacterized protein n=1 Tax=Pseudorhizobium banfieldiae TaxID=1125847 RepID=L0NFS8_9HYPH|nr:hypothetical protein [Pseudorhizobium banfieldiae]CAD6606106.1 hypothetical protein RNT25_01786 [arsenite-oxidising bacterium NT-25]CCF19132.1 protein of unknown function [Pseudorhizobium banfieldiae]